VHEEENVLCLKRGEEMKCSHFLAGMTVVSFVVEFMVLWYDQLIDVFILKIDILCFGGLEIGNGLMLKFCGTACFV